MISENVKKICRLLRKTPYGYKKPELFINLTYKCPLRCKFCYVDYNRTDDFTLEDLEYIFENVILGSEYIKLVTFFGGEPLIKYDYIEHLLNKYYDKCCEENIHLAVITSMAINCDKMLKLHKKYPMFEIVVSFDNYAGERVYANGKHFKVLENIEKYDLENHKHNMCFHIVIDDEKSFQDLKLAQNIFKERGIIYSWCWNKTPNKIFNIEPYYECLEHIIKENRYYPKQFFKEIDNYYNKNNLGCGIGSELFLSSNGDVSPCSISHYNNQFLLLNKGKVDEEIPEIIQHYEETIFDNIKCRDCKLKGFCNGGCIINRLNNGNFNEPNSYLCEQMKQIYQVYEKLENQYNLKDLQVKMNEEYIGNLDYCYNTGINIDMYSYFNLKD